ncbi:MAG TPA: response regulator [Bryobacteraceae bacterium]|nr:response regulator [Bryobacteraceae bacterium]
MPAVLVVDDNPMIRQLVAAALQADGFAVVTAEDGLDAISLMQSVDTEIGLLITDIRMPGMDGWALANRLVTDNPRLPVLFMSSQLEDPDLRGYHQSEFLTKPFSLVTLLSRARTLMNEDTLSTVSSATSS